MYISIHQMSPPSQLCGVSISSHHDRLLGDRLHQHSARFDAALSDAQLESTSTQEMQCRTVVPENVSDNASEVDIDGAVKNDVCRKVGQQQTVGDVNS